MAPIINQLRNFRFPVTHVSCAHSACGVQSQIVPRVRSGPHAASSRAPLDSTLAPTTLCTCALATSITHITDTPQLGPPSRGIDHDTPPSHRSRSRARGSPSCHAASGTSALEMLIVNWGGARSLFSRYSAQKSSSQPAASSNSASAYYMRAVPSSPSLPALPQPPLCAPLS